MHPEQRRLLENGMSLGHGHFAPPLSRKRRLPGDQLNPSRVPVGRHHQAEIPEMDFELRDRGDVRLAHDEVAPRVIVPLYKLLPPRYLPRQPDPEAFSSPSSTQMASTCASESSETFVNSGDGVPEAG